MSFVFISYSHEDSKYAQVVVEALEKRSLAAWIDDRIDYGTQWPRVIQEKLDKCSAVIVIMTPRSEQSEWVNNELAYAKNKRKRVFPLLLAGDVWLSLAATQYVDVRDGKQPPKEFLEQIARAVPARSLELPLRPFLFADLRSEKASEIVLALDKFLSEGESHWEKSKFSPILWILVGGLRVGRVTVRCRPTVWDGVVLMGQIVWTKDEPIFLSQSAKLKNLGWEVPESFPLKFELTWLGGTKPAVIADALIEANAQLGVFVSDITVSRQKDFP